MNVFILDVFAFPGISSWQQRTSAVYTQTACSGSDDVPDQPLLHAAGHGWDIGERPGWQGRTTFWTALYYSTI